MQISSVDIICRDGISNWQVQSFGGIVKDCKSPENSFLLTQKQLPAAIFSCWRFLNLSIEKTALVSSGFLYISRTYGKSLLVDKSTIFGVYA